MKTVLFDSRWYWQVMFVSKSLLAPLVYEKTVVVSAFDIRIDLTIENTLKVEKKVYNFENRRNFPSPIKNASGARRDKHTKKLERNNYADTLPWKVFIASQAHWKWSDNIFHVTAGNVKFAVGQWPNFHPCNFLYETRLYRGNAVSEIPYSRLKKINRDSWIMVDKKHLISCWVELCPKIAAGRQGCIAKKEVWNAVLKPNTKQGWFACKNFYTWSSCFTLVLRCYTRDNLSFIHLCCSRRYS